MTESYNGTNDQQSILESLGQEDEYGDVDANFTLPAGPRGTGRSTCETQVHVSRVGNREEVKVTISTDGAISGGVPSKAALESRDQIPLQPASSSVTAVMKAMDTGYVSLEGGQPSAQLEFNPDWTQVTTEASRGLSRLPPPTAISAVEANIKNHLGRYAVSYYSQRTLPDDSPFLHCKSSGTTSYTGTQEAARRHANETGGVASVRSNSAPSFEVSESLQSPTLATKHATDTLNAFGDGILIETNTSRGASNDSREPQN